MKTTTNNNNNNNNKWMNNRETGRCLLRKILELGEFPHFSSRQMAHHQVGPGPQAQHHQLSSVWHSESPQTTTTTTTTTLTPPVGVALQLYCISTAQPTASKADRDKKMEGEDWEDDHGVVKEVLRGKRRSLLRSLLLLLLLLLLPLITHCP
ncbi:hypothetical protein INR49_029795 [Caranx melampygus]|nr:hypothetical protein INR49_029795 [Caranx melampygus]